MIRRLLPVLLLTVVACNEAVPEAEPFQGTWESQGWGIILHVHGTRADVYETSATHCVLASSSSARNIDDLVSRDGTGLVLADAGRVVRFLPLAALPERCSAPPDASAPAVLAAAVAAVEEHYHPGVDSGWMERVAALVTPAEGDDAGLLAAITGLIGPLGDPVLALQTGDAAIWTPPPAGAGRELAGALLAGTLLPGATVTAGSGIVVTDLGEGVHYLGLLRLGGFADNSGGSQRVIAAALDQALRDAAALVLDLRAATTGAEIEALLVATRFVTAPVVVATVEARVPGDGRVPAGEAVVNPMPTGAFPGRVVLLIGPGTAGPAELLALALASLPNVTLVGEPTAGSPRSPLVRTLPNGWVLGIPNTEVTTADGIARVGTPLVPTVSAPLTTADVAAARDPGLAAALTSLGL